MPRGCWPKCSPSWENSWHKCSKSAQDHTETAIFFRFLQSLPLHSTAEGAPQQSEYRISPSPSVRQAARTEPRCLEMFECLSKSKRNICSWRKSELSNFSNRARTTALGAQLEIVYLGSSLGNFSLWHPPESFAWKPSSETCAGPQTPKAKLRPEAWALGMHTYWAICICPYPLSICATRQKNILLIIFIDVFCRRKEGEQTVWTSLVLSVGVGGDDGQSFHPMGQIRTRHLKKQLISITVPSLSSALSLTSEMCLSIHDTSNPSFPLRYQSIRSEGVGRFSFAIAFMFEINILGLQSDLQLWTLSISLCQLWKALPRLLPAC